MVDFHAAGGRSRTAWHRGSRAGGRTDRATAPLQTRAAVSVVSAGDQDRDALSRARGQGWQE